MKTNKIVYWTATVLLSALLIMSSGMYVFNNEMVQQVFNNLGYPTYLIYPMVIAKLSAIVVILSRKQSKLMEWAYAGLFFEFLLAFFAHIMIKDGEHIAALIAIILLFVSYIFEKKLVEIKIK